MLSVQIETHVGSMDKAKSAAAGHLHEGYYTRDEIEKLVGKDLSTIFAGLRPYPIFFAPLSCNKIIQLATYSLGSEASSLVLKHNKNGFKLRDR